MKIINNVSLICFEVLLNKYITAFSFCLATDPSKNFLIKCEAKKKKKNSGSYQMLLLKLLCFEMKKSFRIFSKSSSKEIQYLPFA